MELSQERGVLANQLGRVLLRVGIGAAPFTASGLIAEARRQTGLSRFDDEAFRVPLDKLLESIEREAQLTPLCRLITRGRLSNAP